MENLVQGLVAHVNTDRVHADRGARQREGLFEAERTECELAVKLLAGIYVQRSFVEDHWKPADPAAPARRYSRPRGLM